jgi:rRNA-processing protein FCF1
MNSLKTIQLKKKKADKNGKIDVATLRRTRIEQLKKMINNEEYLSEAVLKLANSLTSGLMK